MDDGSDIARFQALVRNFLSQHHSVMFFDHAVPYKGCAVISRGARKHLPKIQTVRTSVLRPSGVSSGASTLYRVTYGDSTEALTTCLLPWFLRAHAKTSHYLTLSTLTPNIERRTLNGCYTDNVLNGAPVLSAAKQSRRAAVEFFDPLRTGWIERSVSSGFPFRI